MNCFQFEDTGALWALFLRSAETVSFFRIRNFLTSCDRMKELYELCRLDAMELPGECSAGIRAWSSAVFACSSWLERLARSALNRPCWAGSGRSLSRIIHMKSSSRGGELAIISSPSMVGRKHRSNQFATHAGNGAAICVILTAT